MFCVHVVAMAIKHTEKTLNMTYPTLYYNWLFSAFCTLTATLCLDSRKKPPNFSVIIPKDYTNKGHSGTKGARIFRTFQVIKDVGMFFGGEMFTDASGEAPIGFTNITRTTA